MEGREGTGKEVTAWSGQVALDPRLFDAHLAEAGESSSS